MQVFKQNVYNQFLGEKKILVLKQLYSKWLRQVRFWSLHIHNKNVSLSTYVGLYNPK